MDVYVTEGYYWMQGRMSDKYPEKNMACSGGNDCMSVARQNSQSGAKSGGRNYDINSYLNREI